MKKLPVEQTAYVSLKQTMEFEIKMLEDFNLTLLKEDMDYQTRVNRITKNQEEIYKLRVALDNLELSIKPLIELGYIRKFI